MLTIRLDLRLLSAALAALILAAPLAAQKKDDDDPFATPSKTDPRKPSPKDKANGTWGSDGELRMPVDYKNLPTFGPAGCPVCVVGPSVIDLKTLKTVVELDGKYEARGMKALSAAGKYFAAVDKTPNITGTTVIVWATDTGKKVLEVPGQREAYVDFLELARDKYLLVGGRHNRQIDVWDIETGKITKSLTVPDRRVEPNKITFTPDGKYFACIAHDRIIVTETASGKRAATMQTPAAGPELLEACRALHGCPTGSAKITSGFRLPARWVIHAVGPVDRGGQQGEPALLRSCYETALQIAKENLVRSIAFPSISTGAYGFPKAEACAIAVDAVSTFLAKNDLPHEVTFCCFSDEDRRTYEQKLQQ